MRQTYTNPPGLPPTPQEQAGYAALAKIAGAPGPLADFIARGLPSFDGAEGVPQHEQGHV